ncbi:OmpA-like domain-containing protein [Aromatoleum bremense]|uniref:OmpA family protein n=1 Tax=Aromatoleum bremense TaxID=76115 RepID=A0ABX1NVI6_9RHOO|nr:OmpA family protein [Aromatoleum bremense]NMG15560.1 OmpA family protein [Aromatoleum bremense]QTQ32920.1 OmpA-like domain-containing protein [Aromatoleum bremense]
MKRFSLFVLIGVSALLSACATTTATPPPAAVTPVHRAVPVARNAAFDWSAERNRIVKRLSGSSEIATQVRDDGTLQLLLPGAEAFSRGGTEPQPALTASLDRVASALAPSPEVEIRVFGHTDSLDSELHNLQLSIQRAETVAEHLRRRGIALTRLHADGKGEAEPIADNATEAGRAKNRRVEIVLRPFE